MDGAGAPSSMDLDSAAENEDAPLFFAPSLLMQTASPLAFPGGAFAAVIAFILINVITGALFGVSSADLNDPAAVTRTLLGQEILVNGYFTSVLGAPALNMGVFVGIISGFAGGVIYNKYYNYRKLPAGGNPLPLVFMME